MTSLRRHTGHIRGKAPHEGRPVIPQVAIHTTGIAIATPNGLTGLIDPTWSVIASRAQDGRLGGPLVLPWHAKVARPIVGIGRETSSGL